MSTTIRRFVQGKLLSDVIEGVARTSFVVPETMLVADFLKELGERGFQAAPVYRGDADAPAVVAILSVMEVMTFVSFAAYFRDRSLDEQTFASLNVPAALTVADVLRERVTEEAAHLWVFEPTAALATVIEAMARGVHRVVTFVATADEVSRRRTPLMLTQTDVVRFLFRHEAELDDALTQRRIEELGLVNPAGSESLHSVRSTDKTLACFADLASRGLYAVPVVDEQGALQTSLSASDLKAAHHAYGAMLAPVEGFLKHVHGGKLVHPVTCGVHATLSEIVPSLLAAGIHRVWVVDSARRVLGVVSLSDILAQVDRMD